MALAPYALTALGTGAADGTGRACAPPPTETGATAHVTDPDAKGRHERAARIPAAGGHRPRPVVRAVAACDRPKVLPAVAGIQGP
ncbi:hypothetical protein [Streptomyces hirsutus]|uniref:hypothetical protein n=1 Tax=Streptomyces hirsutus TaxID=35620 RepID=UPI0033C8331D